MRLKKSYPLLTIDEFWDKWDTIDTENAIIFSEIDKKDMDYIFEKKLFLGDKV